MQTSFTEAQLQDPGVARANEILRKCVHCGLCTATCPSYQVLGDELDSPCGRIYLIKDMLESGRPADEKTVKHIDRCLTCLACMTTCPSGVHYMHLVDHAREYIEQTYRRLFLDRWLRWLLSQILPHPGRFRLAMAGAMLAKPCRRLVPALFPGRVGAMIDIAPKLIAGPAPHDDPGVKPATAERRKRVALMTGCAQKALNPAINAATIRLLNRHGCDVVVAAGAGCCGALTQHMGKTALSHSSAAANIRAWAAEMDDEGLDADIVNTSGCGTTVKDYGYMFRHDPGLADDAARVSAITRDISEFMVELGLGEVSAVGRPEAGLRIAYHAACSLQHGQNVTEAPKRLLREAGFEVVEPVEAHLCCGSAGTYNLLQSEIAVQLKARKVANLEATQPKLIAAGNIGCMMQIGSATDLPVVHTAELLDWATGGPKPSALDGR